MYNLFYLTIPAAKNVPLAVSVDNTWANTQVLVLIMIVSVLVILLSVFIPKRKKAEDEQEIVPEQ